MSFMAENLGFRLVTATFFARRLASEGYVRAVVASALAQQERHVGTAEAEGVRQRDLG